MTWHDGVNIVGTLKAIKEVNIANVVRGGQKHKDLTETDISVDLEIEDEKGGLHSETFYGIVFPDSIGHKVEYSYNYNPGGEAFVDIKGKHQFLKDITLDRIYKGSKIEKYNFND